MRTIDMASWPRRKHFDFFNTFSFPHFNLCASVTITTFRRAAQERGLPFTASLVYLLARAANRIPEFRQRIRGQEVVEHTVIHPSFIVPSPHELFSFCMIPYGESFSLFAAEAVERMAQVQEAPTLDDGPGQDDLLFMTSIPWVTFSGLQHPIRMSPVDSVPRIAWGRYHTVEDRLEMPLAVQAHHALVDGLHAGRYFAQVQEYLDRPEPLLDS
jgi:chloramphenicol O-acetyltransferase type A